VTIKGGRRLKGKGTQTVQAGERLVVMTPGGGGWGAPEARDARLIAADVREERVPKSA
jgi:N-methylhydantoinase B